MDSVISSSSLGDSITDTVLGSNCGIRLLIVIADWSFWDPKLDSCFNVRDALMLITASDLHCLQFSIYHLHHTRLRANLFS